MALPTSGNLSMQDAAGLSRSIHQELYGTLSVNSQQQRLICNGMDSGLITNVICPIAITDFYGYSSFNGTIINLRMNSNFINYTLSGSFTVLSSSFANLGTFSIPLQTQQYMNTLSFENHFNLRMNFSNVVVSNEFGQQVAASPFWDIAGDTTASGGGFSVDGISGSVDMRVVFWS